MAEADPRPSEQPEALRIVGVIRPAMPEGDEEWGKNALQLFFNRPPSDDEMRAIHDLPPSPQIARDARHFAERVILAELACRLFRTLVLGGIIIAESPAAMDWLKTWIDGVGHGPMGSGPLRWPETLPTVSSLLREWGFQPTPTMPAFVMRQPHQQGVPTRRAS